MNDVGRIGAATAGKQRPWWDSAPAIAAAIVVVILPLLYPRIPPLVDMLGHMARFRVELDGSRSTLLQQYFGYRWSPIGNLGVDLPVRLLAPLVGLEPAVKLVICAIPALTLAGFLWLAREVHGRIPPPAWFAAPFVYNHAFLHGFVNFALSMALAFPALALWVRLGRLDRTRLRAALFAPIGLIVYFAHAFGWGVLGLMCFFNEAARLRGLGIAWRTLLVRVALATSVLALPILTLLLWRSGGSGSGASDWFNLPAKLVWAETALRDRWRAFDLASVGVAVLVLGAALRNGRLGFVRELSWPGLALLAAFLLLPSLIFESAYADMRLAPYLFGLLLIAVRLKDDVPHRYSSTLAALAAAFLVVRIAGNGLSFALAADDQQSKAEAVPNVAPGARVATFVGFACGGEWALPRNLHLGSLVVIRRYGFSNDLWLTKALNILEMRYRAPGYYAADPSQFVLPNGCEDGLHRTIDQSLAAFPRADFDYVWLIDAPPFDPRLLAGLEPIWSGAGSQLYRIRRG